MSALSDPKSLMPSVSVLSYEIPSFPMLVDSGFSDCFIDTLLVNKHALQTYSVPPLQLQLFDGTSNSMITQAIDLSVCFSSGNITPMTFYATLLDGSCFLVLGHNWLTCHNLLINWVLSSILFHSSKQDIPTPLCIPPQPLSMPPLTVSSSSDSP